MHYIIVNIYIYNRHPILSFHIAPFRFVKQISFTFVAIVISRFFRFFSSIYYYAAKRLLNFSSFQHLCLILPPRLPLYHYTRPISPWIPFFVSTLLFAVQSSMLFVSSSSLTMKYLTLSILFQFTKYERYRRRVERSCRSIP